MQIEKFSKKQGEILKFAYSDEGVLICDGAVRSGKTSIMMWAFVDWAMNNFNGQRFGVCGKTVEEAKAAIAKTKSPYLKRDLEKFIARQEKKSKRRT